jgi:hypothetical protein
MQNSESHDRIFFRYCHRIPAVSMSSTHFSKEEKYGMVNASEDKGFVEPVSSSYVVRISFQVFLIPSIIKKNSINVGVMNFFRYANFYRCFLSCMIASTCVNVIIIEYTI